jgi:serine/threonine protein kinase
MEVLGKKREFSLEIIWTIISDVSEAIRVASDQQDLNDQNFYYLGLKPENVILTGDDQYKIVDLFFNDYVIQGIKKTEEQRTHEKLAVFPHLSGKKEHTVVYFNKDGNEYINSKIKGRDERGKVEEKASVWNPYVAPEALQQHISVLGYSENFQKADSFSIGMLFLRLLCNLTDTPFEQFAHLNKQIEDDKYNEVLYEIVKYGEREKLEKELGVIIPLIMKDTFYRMIPEKIYTTIQAEFL